MRPGGRFNVKQQEYRPALRRRLFPVAVTGAALSLGGCFGFGGGSDIRYRAEARIVESIEDLTGGPGATGRRGDIVIENAYLRAIIAVEGDAGGAPGGHLVDLDAKRLPLDPGGDVLGAVVPWHNFGRTARPEKIEIIDSGHSTGRAVVRVTAVDALLPGFDVDAHLAAALGAAEGARAGGIDPAAAVPVEIRTDYILGPEDRGVRIETTFVNLGAAPLKLAVGDILTMRAPADPFRGGGSGLRNSRPAPGFGPAAAETGWNRLAWVGWQAADVAYIYQPGTAEVAALRGQTGCVEFGVRTACVAGFDFTAAGGPISGALTPGRPWLEVPPRGQGTATWRRWIFADGRDLAGAVRGALAVRGVHPAHASVTVRDSAGPVAGVDVAVLTRSESGALVPWLAGRTDEGGELRLPLAPGNWTIAVQRRGAGNPAADGLPERVEIQGVVEGAPDTPVAFTVARGGRLEAWSRRDDGAPVPAQIWILGNDGDPETLHSDPDGRLLAAATTRTLAIRPFGDPHRQPLPAVPAGVTGTTLTTAEGTPLAPLPVVRRLQTDADGLAVVDLPAGSYVAVAARGPLHAAAVVPFDVVADATTRILLDLPRVIDAGGWAGFDPSLQTAGSPESMRLPAAVLAEASAAGLDAVALAAVQQAADGAGDVPPGLAVLGGQTMDLGALRIAGWGLEVPALPLRSKPTPGANEAVDGHGDGAAVAAFTDAGRPLTPAAAAAALIERGAADMLLLQPARGNRTSAWFDRLGLTWNLAAGWGEPAPAAVIGSDPLTGAAAAPALAQPWALLGLGDGRSRPADVWRATLDAFAFWSLGRDIGAVAGSDARAGDATAVGAARTWVFVSDATDAVVDAAAGGFAAALSDALAGRRTVAGNGPWLDVLVTARLLNEAGAVTTVVQTVGPGRPGDVLSINPALFPAGASLALEVTVAVTVQTPTWLPPQRLEWFHNAAANVTVAESDITGAALLPLAAAARQWTAADLTTATVPATIRVAGADGVTTITTAGSRIELREDWNLRLEDAEVRAGQDRWLAVRLVGQGTPWPMLAGAGGEAMVPYALSSPVWLDLAGGGSGVFDTDIAGPCEAAGNPACPVAP